MKKLLLICLLASAPAFAFDFKGIEVGNKYDLASLSNKHGLACDRMFTGEAYYCKGNTTIVGADAKIFISLNLDFYIDSITVNFDPSNFEVVKTAMLDKFKKPTTNKNGTVQNGMGATFQQNILEWNNETGLMTLYKYYEKVSESTLFIISKEVLDKSKQKLNKDKNDI